MNAERLTPDSGSEDLYRQMFRRHASVKLLIDPSDGSIVDANPAAERYYGYPPGRLNTMRIWQINAMDPESVKAAIADALAGRRNAFRFRHRLASGDLRDVEVHSSTVELAGRTLLYSIVHDVTEQKELERALRESEERYRLVADNAHDLIVVCATDGRWLFASPSHRTILGWEPPELEGKCVFDYIHPDDLPRQREAFQSRIASGKPRSVELRLRHRDGHWVWVESLGVPLVGPGGTVDRILATVREIGERKKAEESLREAEAKYRNLVEGSLIGVYIIQDGRFVYVNPRFAEIFGFRQEEINGKLPFADLVAPEDRETVSESVQRRIVGEVRNVRYAFRGLRKDGAVIDVEVYGAQTTYGGRSAVIGSLVDVTERKRAEKMQAALYRIAEETSAAEDLERAFAAVHRIVGELMDARNFYIALLDPAGQQLEFPYFVDEFDAAPPAKRLGRGITEFVLRTGRAALVPPERFRALVASGDVEPQGAPSVDWLGVPLQTSSGTIGAVVVQSYSEGARYTERDRDLLEFVSKHIASAIERRRAEDRIRYLAFHDALTDLPNRLLFHDRLTLAVAQAHRTRAGLAVMFLDLDRFKIINDSLGHSVGDRLLVAVARRVAGRLREGDTLARLGGDEFILLLPGIGGPADAMRAAQKILSCFRAPFDVEGQEMFATASVGVSLYPHDGETAETLIQNADIAMYRAKEMGRDNYQLYTAELHGRAQARMEMENSLRAAVMRGELTLLYQPLVALDTGCLTGFEALCYWRRPDGRLTPPGEFIPLAEETGLIVPLGEWVIREACRQMRAWRRDGRPGHTVSVNLSARQFQQPGLIDLVSGILAETGLAGSQLEIEVTESVAMGNVPAVTDTMNRLKRLGLRMTLDDFGTGYSSLEYLKNFPLDTLKIDRGFVRDMAADSRDAAVVAAAVALARGMGLRVVAEGVETERQLELLRALGCDAFQGYLASRPVPSEEAGRLIEIERLIP